MGEQGSHSHTDAAPSAADRSLRARALALRIVGVLQQAGHVAHLAGGCVRDELLGLPPKDYDVATSARPEEVRALFPRSRFVGEAFGVVLVGRSRPGQGEQPIEVATFRAEADYADGRHPSTVHFTDARHDARRRDFTVNGLFQDPAPAPGGQPPRQAVAPNGEGAPPVIEDTPHGRIIDYVGGLADLRAGVIRAIGQADERFAEDYLRLLRAVRFAAALGFTLERATAAAIRAHARHLAAISRERIGQEVRRMFEGPRPALAAELMQRLHLDAPTLNEDHAEPALPVLTALAGDAAGERPGFAQALAAWMIDRHGAALDEAAARQRARQLVPRWRQALCLTNQDQDELSALVRLLPAAMEWGDLATAARKRLLAQPHWPAAERLLRALARAGAGGAAVARVAGQIEADGGELRAQGLAPTPLVTGQDLIDLGQSPGPRFAKWLAAAYDAQLEGRVATREQALAWLRAQVGPSERA